jgi:hypothetical protein
MIAVVCNPIPKLACIIDGSAGFEAIQLTKAINYRTLDRKLEAR